MKALQYLLVAMPSILLTACDKPLRTASTTVKTEEAINVYCGRCRPCKWHPGEIDDQGRLVVFEAAGLCKTLESDYALVLLNTGDHVHPAARYDLSSKISGYQSFTTLGALMERIGNIPEPRVLDFYGTCGAPPFVGLPETQTQAFFDAMKKAKVELRSGDNTTICTCPCPKCK
jgi:hypothetical protein